MQSGAWGLPTAVIILLSWAVGNSVTPAVADDIGSAAADDTSSERRSLPSGLVVHGGVSAGWFAAADGAKGPVDSRALLTNLLITLTTADAKGPIGLDAAVGETATPSLQGPPQVNREIHIEYAALLLRLRSEVELATGLLKPVSGFEDTYTYNNRNIVHGVVSSSQPYNAYGAALRCSMRGLEGHLGYYSDRLAPEEYSVGEHPPGRAWEVDLGGQVAGVSCRAYHYHLRGMRYLTGGILEHTIAGVHLALNADLCQWDKSMRDHYGRRHAQGAALYVVPAWGRLSLPTRLEAVAQGSSRFYLDGTATQPLWSVTASPTWRWTGADYMRAEASFAHAKDGFGDGQSGPRSHRVYVAGEVGYLF